MPPCMPLLVQRLQLMHADVCLTASTLRAVVALFVCMHAVLLGEVCGLTQRPAWLVLQKATAEEAAGISN